MASFKYDAIDDQGARISGRLEAVSRAAALSDLEAKRLTPTNIAETRPPIRLGGSIPTRKLAQTYTQMADLLDAGVPLLRALGLMAKRRASPRLAESFAELAGEVSEGRALADAMGDRPRIFPRVHVAMVRAGERAGNLETVLRRLGTMLEAQADLQDKVVGSLIYPAILVVAGLGILTTIFVVFVPMFRPLFARIGDDLPGMTRLVFTISDALTTHGLITAITLAVAVVVAKLAAGRPDVAEWLAIIRTRSPVVGPLTRATATARFCRMLGTMLESGVPILGAMSIAREATSNVLMERAIDGASEAIRGGDSLAPPLEQCGLFEPDVVEMIAVAESANNLDKVLTTIAETIERRIDRLLSALLKLVEPIMLMLIAGAVVLVAIALLVPMTQLSGSIS